MSAAGTWNTIKGVLDPGGIILSQDKEAPGLPSWQTQQGELAAKNAARLSEIINTGQVQNAGVHGEAQQIGPAVPQMLAARAQNTFSNLDPNNNSAWQVGKQWNDAAARGDLAERVGGTNANAALGQANQVAQGIGGAGMANAGAQGNVIAGAAGDLRGIRQGIQQTTQDNNIIRNSALGNGPSAAQILAKQQLDQSIQAQASQAAQARGGNVAAGMRAAANAGSQMQLQGAQQMSALRAQEQLNAQGLLVQGNNAVTAGQNALTGANTALGGQVAQARGQDIGQAVSSATAANDIAKTATANFGVGSDLAKAGLAGQTQLSSQYGNQMLAQEQMKSNAQQNYADWLQKQYSIASGIAPQYAGIQGQMAIANQQTQQQQDAANKSLLGGLIGGLI